MLLFAAALVCVDCHRDVVERYALTAMANTSGQVRAANETPGKVGPYTVTPDLRLVWAAGQVQLSFFIGSRRMGRSFAFEYQQGLYQAPVGYYANRRVWDMAPGYEHDTSPDLSRPITTDCLFCHANRAMLEPTPSTGTSEIAAGIQCARCHGAYRPFGFVNPRNSAPRLRDSICEQCHLAGEVRLLSPERKLRTSFPATTWRISSKSSPVTEKASQLMDTPMPWPAAGANRNRATGYGAEPATARIGRPRAIPQSAAIVTRPRTTSPTASRAICRRQAYDGGHTVFTDHSISGEAGQGFTSFRRRPSDRNLGLAYVRLASTRHDSNYLDRAWPLLRAAAADDRRDPELYFQVANVLAAAGRKKLAIEYYRRTLREDPLQPDALLKLASLLEPSAEARELRAKASRILPVPHK
jgi:hypothetical protein